jgi:hypothetical protein
MAPSDPRVKLIEVPGLLMAALSYSGTWSRGQHEENENRLKELIRQRGLKMVGEPVLPGTIHLLCPGFCAATRA